MRTNIFRLALATNMGIHTDNMIAGGVNKMQIVGYKDDAATAFIAQPLNQLIDIGLPHDIHTLHRFIEDEYIRLL